MTVARILALKGNDVVTVAPHRTMAEIVELLAEKRIGTVVVTGPNDGIVGIVSERDVVKALAAHGAGMLTDPVSAYMTHAVVTVGVDETVEEVMDRMTEGRFRHMPVVDNRRLCGIVSIGDVVKHRIAMVEAEASAMRDYIATA